VPYATLQDLKARIGEPRLVQLTDIGDPPTGLPDDAVAQRALDDADAEIDAALVGRYALPLATPPAVLKVHAVTLAHFRLLGAAATELDQAEAKHAREYLRDLASGKVPLLPPAVTSQPAGAGSVLFSPGDKVMGREGREGRETAQADGGRGSF
jgi:phage gp36-like protein